MNNWVKGDTIICIETSVIKGITRCKKGNKYIANNLYNCVKCGASGVDIGVSTTDYPEGYTTCNCEELMPMKGVWWIPSKFFIKSDDIKKQIEIAIQEENYELAEFLNKYNN